MLGNIYILNFFFKNLFFRFMKIRGGFWIIKVLKYFFWVVFFFYRFFGNLVIYRGKYFKKCYVFSGVGG